MQRHGTAQERAVEPRLIELAYARDIALVATNEPFFPKRDDYEAHDALIAIAEGAVVADGERRRLTEEHYFKTRAEMAALFADLPEALENTIEIATRCVWWPQMQKPILPRFADATATGDSVRAEAELLRAEAREGLAQRLAAHGLAPGLTEEDYAKRLEYELDVIEKMQYPGYFLIVADFIQWAKSRGIPVGPGRGSGAGSVVAWSLTITDLDPLRFTLIFERFLNPDRVSMPDFDVDFCQNRRDEVIQYVAEKYGADQVAQIITFGTLQARAVLRDVGRVLQMPYGQVDRLAKMVPQNPAAPVTLSKAIADDPQLQAGARRRSAGGAPPRHRPEAGGALPPRLDPRRRHRDRRPAAEPACAALSRSALGHEGHPVQHEVGRAGGAGEVRFPRPEDADRSRSRRAAGEAPRHRGRSLAPAARRQEELRAARPGRYGRHLPAGKRRHAPRGRRHAARPLRGPDRAGRALSPGPDGEHPDLLPAQARQGAGRIPAPACSSRS